MEDTIIKITDSLCSDIEQWDLKSIVSFFKKINIKNYVLSLFLRNKRTIHKISIKHLEKTQKEPEINKISLEILEDDRLEKVEKNENIVKILNLLKKTEKEIMDYTKFYSYLRYENGYAYANYGNDDYDFAIVKSMENGYLILSIDDIDSTDRVLEKEEINKIKLLFSIFHLFYKQEEIIKCFEKKNKKFKNRLEERDSDLKTIKKILDKNQISLTESFSTEGFEELSIPKKENIEKPPFE